MKPDRSKIIAYLIAYLSLLSPFAISAGQTAKTASVTMQPATPIVMATSAPATQPAPATPTDPAFRAAMAAADAQRRGPNIPEPDYRLLVRGELCVWQSNTTIAYYKIVAGDDKVNGRGLTIGSDDPANPIHDVYVYATMVQSNGDDGACVWNYAHDIHYDNCWFFHRSTWPDRNDYRFANKCFLAGADPSSPTPSYLTWWTASHCLYNGGFRSPAIRGGRFQIDKSLVLQSRRNVWTEATGNVIDTDFFIQYPMQVRGGDNPWTDSWTRSVRPILLYRPIPEGLYFSGCRLFTLDGDGRVVSAKFATGPELCRLAPPGAGDDCEGCVDSDIDVPASVFRSTRWPIDARTDSPARLPSQ